jgi:hypothetical protein
MCHYIVEGQNLVELKSGEIIEFSSDCRCETVQAKVGEVLELVDVPYGQQVELFEAVVDGAGCGSGTLQDLEAFAKAIARAQSVDALRQRLMALIAMRRLALEQGGYPEVCPDLEVLSAPDPFTGKRIAYARNPDGSLTLAFDGAAELLEPITVASAFKTVAPVTLPAP